MKVLICGSRTWTDPQPIRMLLAALENRKDTTVIHGGARGADSLAGELAREYRLPVEVYPADWAEHGRAAGPIRNQRMLDKGKPRLVVAFTEQPPTTGTADMIAKAKNAGVLVWIVGHG